MTQRNRQAPEPWNVGSMPPSSKVAGLRVRPFLTCRAGHSCSLCLIPGPGPPRAARWPFRVKRPQVSHIHVVCLLRLHSDGFIKDGPLKCENASMKIFVLKTRLQRSKLSPEPVNGTRNIQPLQGSYSKLPVVCKIGFTVQRKSLKHSGLLNAYF